VDDIITAIPKNKVKETKKVFNSFNENITFTLEKEENNRIAFLDIWLIRTADGTIKTDWYHKETRSGGYLHFNSHLPFTYKRNTIKILADKIVKLSDVEFHDKNFNLLAKVLMENNYPKELIWNTIRSTLEKNITRTEIEKEIWICSHLVCERFIRKNSANLQRHEQENCRTKWQQLTEIIIHTTER